MNRVTQNLLILLLGGALLKISVFSADFANYVKPGFRPLLIAAGAMLVALAVAALVFDRRRSTNAARQRELLRARAAEEAHLAQMVARDPIALAPVHSREHEHEHAGGHRVAWLLLIPLVVIFLVAPPALGSFAVRQDEQSSHVPPPTIVEARPTVLKNGRVNVLSMLEFANLAWDDPSGSLRGKTIRLTGFVVPSGRDDAWHLTRMRIGCCAADALTMQVVVKGAPVPETDSWVRVTGTWIPRKTGRTGAYTLPEMTASRVEPIAAPDEPYE
ncbi:TIGR03943 family protein [Planomonospora sp. ID91781]|uniref:TIGR03943 family putative permease subunit n=1 Tax=Planomonospora sp. ID91781 TaxID=2738135 RepID=UPI0018C3E192|nr:TIGR03943 family protein [Planomonospora sp. ID91781]MBG0823682.1 TIGR03943 family protein [Planomonospora sp. ID91781]